MVVPFFDIGNNYKIKTTIRFRLSHIGQRYIDPATAEFSSQCVTQTYQAHALPYVEIWGRLYLSTQTLGMCIVLLVYPVAMIIAY